MSQLKDVLDVQSTVTSMVALMGCTLEFAKEWHERCQALGKAVCDEQGVEYGTEEATRIPHETPLGLNSQRRFESLGFWLKSQHAGFAKTA